MSRLETMSKPYREAAIKKSIYTDAKQYKVSHSRALSDGDVHGKGELNNSVGSSDDIKQEKTLIAKNKYQSGSKEYNQSNA